MEKVVIRGRAVHIGKTYQWEAIPSVVDGVTYVPLRIFEEDGRPASDYVKATRDGILFVMRYPDEESLVKLREQIDSAIVAMREARMSGYRG